MSGAFLFAEGPIFAQSTIMLLLLFIIIILLLFFALSLLIEIL